MLVAFVESSTSLEATIMSTEAWFTMASIGLTVTASMTVAVVGAFCATAILATEVGGTVASAVVAFSVGLIAPVGTRLHRAVITRESNVAPACLAGLITHTVSTAIVGADVGLGSTIQSKKTNRAKAGSLIALSTVLLTPILASLLRAVITLPSDLAQASGIV